MAWRHGFSRSAWHGESSCRENDKRCSYQFPDLHGFFSFLADPECNGAVRRATSLHFRQRISCLTCPCQERDHAIKQDWLKIKERLGICHNFRFSSGPTPCLFGNGVSVPGSGGHVCPIASIGHPAQDRVRDRAPRCEVGGVAASPDHGGAAGTANQLMSSDVTSLHWTDRPRC